MRYSGSVYRPPSEAESLIVQITLGCSHNKCTFCSMYKDKPFKIRPLEDVLEDLRYARKAYPQVQKVFLADGDALILPMDSLRTILMTISELFPECKRVGIYGSPKSILLKTPEELTELRTLGLGIVYLGVETGNDPLLKAICKGVSRAEMILAGQTVKASGLKLSAMIISGLGGSHAWQDHARDSASAISAMDPDYVGLLTLLVSPGTELYEEVHKGSFTLLSPEEVFLETKLFVEQLDLTNAVFRSNHASNYVALSGNLPQDKQRLLSQIDQALEYNFGKRDERHRRL